MHPFFRVLFYGSPFLTLMALVALAYTEGRFALAWDKTSAICLKIAIGVVYVLLTVSGSIVGTVWISQWLSAPLVVCTLVVLAILISFAAGAIAEKAEGYGWKRRHRFLNDVAESAARRSN